MTVLLGWFLCEGIVQGESVDPDQVGLAAHNRGVERHAQGRLIEARDLYEQALAAWAGAHGENHPLTALALRHIAMIHMQTGWTKKALPLLERVVAIRRTAYGDQDVETGSALAELAAAHAALDHPRRAEESYLEALAILEPLSEEDTEIYDTALENLASFYLGELRFGKAREWYRKLVELRARTLGSTHELTQRAKADLAIAEGRISAPAALSLVP